MGEETPADAGTPIVPLEIEILTLFPGMFTGPLSESIPGRVQSRGLAAIRVHDLRQWGLGRHKTGDVRIAPSSCRTRAARSSVRRGPTISRGVGT
jgi:hypothetical protein